MSSRLDDLKRAAAKLSDAERAELALALIDSLDALGDGDVEGAWLPEIERRVGQMERGEVQAISGDEVFARLRRQLG
jgi:putative addiction module component (TIGR02574 family)